MSTTSMTYREALRAALREELDRDERVFLLGEDIGAFATALHVTKGLLADYTATGGSRHPERRAGHRRRGGRRGARGPAPGGRADDDHLRHAQRSISSS